MTARQPQVTLFLDVSTNDPTLEELEAFIKAADKNGANSNTVVEVDTDYLQIILP